MKKIGRPTKYKPIFCKKLLEHFNKEPNTIEYETFYYKNGDEKKKPIRIPANLPTLTGFAKTIKVDEDTVLAWTKKHKDFLGAYKRAKELQKDIWITNGLLGLYNPYFAGLMGKNIFGWKDKSEQENKHTGTINIKRVSNL